MRLGKIQNRPNEVGLYWYTGNIHYTGGIEVEVIDLDDNAGLRVIIADYPYPVSRYPGTWQRIHTQGIVTATPDYFDQFAAVE